MADAAGSVDNDWIQEAMIEFLSHLMIFVGGVMIGIGLWIWIDKHA